MLRMGDRGREMGGECRQAATAREVGGEFTLRRGLVVVDGGRLGYMTFVSMVMVSLSPTRREMVL